MLTLRACLLVLLAAAGCKEIGSTLSPSPPPMMTPTPLATGWRGTSTSVAGGAIELTLSLNQNGNDARGSFTLGPGRTGTLSGTIANDLVSLDLRQTAPCNAAYAYGGSLFDGGDEIAGLWRGTECDGRTTDGAFTVLAVGASPRPRALVAGTWAITFRHSTIREDFFLLLDQDSEVVRGTLVDALGFFVVGSVAGVVTETDIFLVIQQNTPCVTTRTIAADLTTGVTVMDGRWSGVACTGLTVNGGGVAATLR